MKHIKKFESKINEDYELPDMSSYSKKDITPTALEILSKKTSFSYEVGYHTTDNGYSSDDCLDAMIEFAKIHVKAALEQAYEQGEIEEVKKVDKYDYADSSNYGINKSSILRSYPLKNII